MLPGFCNGDAQFILPPGDFLMQNLHWLPLSCTPSGGTRVLPAPAHHWEESYEGFHFHGTFCGTEWLHALLHSLLGIFSSSSPGFYLSFVNQVPLERKEVPWFVNQGAQFLRCCHCSSPNLAIHLTFCSTSTSLHPLHTLYNRDSSALTVLKEDSTAREALTGWDMQPP